MSFLLGILAGSAMTIIAGLLLWMRLKQHIVGLERRSAEAERLAELGILTGGLAHEIKNPLSTLQLNLQLLQEDLEGRMDASLTPESARQSPDGRMLRRLQSVSNEAERLREILDDFLRYAGRIEPEREPVDLRAVAEEMVDFLSPQAQVAKVRLGVEAPPGAYLAPVDAGLLKQALLNLLLNAIQHSQAGDAVRIRLQPPGRGEGAPTIRIDVVDEGSGIAEADRKRVFEPYFSRRKGGTGLGLAVTRRIVQAHDGRLEVTTTPGEGTTFSIIVPAMPERTTLATGVRG